MNILVTGGASGLGESITRTLAENAEDSVYFTYHKSSVQAKKIQEKHKNTQAIVCDFENPESLDNLLLKMREFKINVLVNNAFTGFEKNHFHKLAPGYFSHNFNKNILPVVRITQQAILLFRKEKFGKIITILSSAIINKPPIGWSEYVAQKSYLLSLCKSWAVENASFNITSNSISPSFMLTRLNNETDERVVEEMTHQHPLKKLLSPEEVAQSVYFLAHCSQQLNGSNMILNAASDVI
jgi:3-oxoacyl-[acyl-carrier protein] reductase